jgi:transportin-1
VLTLLAALSNHSPTIAANGVSNHQLALQARDDALSESSSSYGDLCCNFCRVLACPSPHLIPEVELKKFHDGDFEMFTKCCGWMMDNGGVSENPKRQDMVMWNTLRQMAGLLLKNALVAPPLPRNTPIDALGRVLPGNAGRMELSPNHAVEIKLGLLTCITDSEPSVRGAASTTIARACTAAVHLEKSMKAFCIKNWLDLIPFILQCIVAGNDASTPEVENAWHDASIGALNTLRKLLEDIPNRLVSESPPASFHELVPALLQCLSSHSESRRKEALMCLNSFIFPMPGSLVAHMDGYLSGLSALSSDPNPDVRKLVCKSIVTLLEHRPEYLQPLIASISEFMLRATADDDTDVALEACEFWLTYASLDEDVSCAPEMMDTIVGIFPQLLPQLLKRMVYPPEKIEELMEDNALDEQNGEAGDRDQDVAPVFHKSRTKGQSDDHGGTHGDDSDGDDDEDDDDDMDDDDNEWTLRKCAAASLDALAGLFGASNTLPSLLPALQEGLGHHDQWVREASILALGAIADGCKAELTPHLPMLHPFLLRQLTAAESMPQLRCIAAWTLARYASWTVDQLEMSDGGGGGDPSLVGQVAEAFALRMLDPHKKVQIALCSAMGVFAETAGDHLTPFLEPIYGIFVQALHKYGTRSRLVLFDTMGVMAENVGEGVGQGSLPGIYIPELLKLWNNTAINNPFDRTLLPLIECLGSSTVVCGLNYQPWALETFEMAMSTIEACMIIISHEDDLGDIDEEMTDPIICSVDLIDGLVEGLGPNFASLVNGSSKFGPTFPDVLQNIAGHCNTGVRMSAYALLGDLARQAPSLIEAGLSDLLSEAVSSIDPTHSAMCNNAVWALGEVCVRCGDNPGPLAPHADDLLASLIPLLMGDAVDIDGNTLSLPGIKENAATTMGRLAMVNPNFVAPDLGRFLLGWCDGMSKISDPRERRDAFAGFVVALRANPPSIQATGQQVGDVVNAILFAIFSWHLPQLQEDMPDNLNSGPYEFEPFPDAFGELLTSLRQLLLDLKTSLGQGWTEIEAQMPKRVVTLMKEVYHI